MSQNDPRQRRSPRRQLLRQAPEDLSTRSAGAFCTAAHGCSIRAARPLLPAPLDELERSAGHSVRPARSPIPSIQLGHVAPGFHLSYAVAGHRRLDALLQHRFGWSPVVWLCLSTNRLD